MPSPDLQQLIASLDALDVMAWVAARDTLQLTAATAAARAALGLGHVLPRWPEWVHPDDRGALDHRAGATHLDCRMRGPMGAWTWLRVELRHTPAGLLAIASATGALRSDAERAAEANFDSLVEHLPFDFFQLNAPGFYVRQNAQSRAMWGDYVGRRLEDVQGVSEANRRTWLSANARAMAGEVVQHEVELEVNGEDRVFASVVAPVRQRGVVRGILGLNIDITARRQAEARSEKLVGELQKSLAALDEAQLQLVARERLAALGELAAVVAHEVRNPLGAIFNALGQLKKEVSGDAQHELLLSIIDEEATRLDRMVRNLLSYARPIHPQLQPEPLEPLLREALGAALSASDDPRSVNARVEVSPSLGPVPVDMQLLRMALTNLFTNALAAMPSGGTLTVSAMPESHDGVEWAEIQVRDTGHGIMQEHLPRIFEPFFTTRAAGTGLGLAVVKRIMEAHRGAVVALSDAGQGTTFALYLPR